MKLTPQQISGFAAIAGFNRQDLNVAVAIAMAESGGDTQALADLDITPGGSLGLWQINLRWHPEYQPDPSALYNPQVNADAAYKVFKTQGFSAWSTYNSGAYLKFLHGGPQTFLDETD